MTLWMHSKRMLSPLAIGLVASLAAGTAMADPIKAVLGGDLQVLDPIASSSYATRTFGYLVYDTLFARDADGNIQPQMVDSYTVSDDGLTWVFKLRPGTVWSDGTAVTSADVVASIERWEARDGLGKQLKAATVSLTATYPMTVELKLASPFGMVLDAFAKEGSPVPFIMPAKLAAKPATEANTEVLGSGPYIFDAANFVPGSKADFLPNPKYTGPSQPASGMWGNKLAKNPVEIVSVPDAIAQVNGLMAGEVDFVQYPSFDMLSTLASNPDITVADPGPTAGNVGFLRLNHAQPPFDNPKIRKVAALALDRGAIMTAAGIPAENQNIDCLSFFSCGTAYEAHKGGEGYRTRNVAEAKKLLAEAGYKGELVDILSPQDDLGNVTAPVIQQELEEVGFKVKVEQMDLNTIFERRASKAPVSEGGWSAFISYLSAMDTSSPVTHLYLNNNCNPNYAGWSCDEEMRKLQDAFASETDPVKRQELVDAVNVRAQESLPAIIWGVYSQPVAMRGALADFNFKTSTPVFWGAVKN